MNYAIIGTGNVGTALARQFARSGIKVGIANTRGPASIAPLAQELGDLVVPQTMADALASDVVILAVPFRAYAAVAAARAGWSGTVIVDAMNAYGVAPDELQGKASTEVVAEAFPGAKVVKSLNQLPAKVLAQDPAGQGGRRVMFVSSNDDNAQAVVSALIADLGFAPISLGKLHEGGKLLGMGGPLLLQNLIKLA